MGSATARAVAPERLTASLAASINVGAIDLAAGYFTRDACLITPDATAVRGRTEIRAIVAQLIAQSCRIEVKGSWVLAAGDTAFGSERWHIRTAGPADSPFEQRSSAGVVMREVEGLWKLALLAPWGWGGSAGDVRSVHPPEAP